MENTEKMPQLASLHQIASKFETTARRIPKLHANTPSRRLRRRDMQGTAQTLSPSRTHDSRVANATHRKECGERPNAVQPESPQG